MKKYLILFLLLLTIPASANFYTHYAIPSFGPRWVVPSDIPAAEAQALMDLYFATSGNSWTNGAQGSGADAWGDTATADDWYGCTVVGGHVTALEMPNNALSGNILSSHLPTTIETLDLGQNTGISDIDVSLLTAADDIDLEDCGFGVLVVQGILADIDTAGVSNGTLKIGGTDSTNYNKSPNTTAAMASISALETKTWTVDYTTYRDVVGHNSNLLNYWPMDETSGTTMTAAAGGINLTIDGATVNQTGQVDGGSVLFDGVNDYGYSASSIDFSAENKLCVEMLINYTYKSAGEIVAELSASATGQTDAFMYAITEPSSNSNSNLLLKSDGGVNYKLLPRPGAGVWHHVVAVFDKSASAADEVRYYVDGVEISCISNPASSEGANNFGDHVLYIASRAGSEYWTQGYIQHIAIYSDLSASDIEEHAAAAGIFPVYKVKSEDIWYSAYDNVNNIAQASYSKFIFDTAATSVTVAGYNNMYGEYPQYAKFGLLVDGVEQTSLSFSDDGNETFVCNIGGAGSTKRVELITNLSRHCSLAYHHTVISGITSITGGSVSVVPPAAATEMIVYGDSIHSGALAAGAEYDSLVPLLRETYGFDVACEGISCRTLYDDTNTEALRAAFVAHIASYSPTTIWFGIGTNDYGLEEWSASDFGTAYAATLDDLHTALPSATIYCQTPLVRDDETANTFGDTLGDYRTQITTACSTRSTWAVLVDGTAILELADLDDGVHPTTAGHAKYALYINNYLNN